MGQSEEASVEEILESIKKVIARDNRLDAAAMRRQRETDGVTQAPDSAEEASEEVLDLAEMEFVEDNDVASDQTDSLIEEEALEADTELEANEDAPLTNDAARQNMRENLDALAMLAQPSAPPQIVRSGETSLEGLAREMLRPMLAEWLDANLPGMVEQMVQDEIARIARKDK